MRRPTEAGDVRFGGKCVKVEVGDGGAGKKGCLDLENPPIGKKGPNLTKNLCPKP